MNPEQAPPTGNNRENWNKQDFRQSILTDRDLFYYMEAFKIDPEELDDPNSMILDLGSGLQQELARQVKELGLQSKIVSVDPKLGLSLEKDLQKLTGSNQKLRERARKNLPENSLAAVAQALPFKNESFNKIYALFSVPYYLSHPEDIRDALIEMIRITKKGGVIKTFPLLDLDQLKIVRECLIGISDVEFEIISDKKELFPDEYDKEIEEEKMLKENWSLVIKKKQKTAE